MADTYTRIGHALEAAQLFYDFSLEKAKEVCEAMPENPCIGASFAIACFPNPGYFICRVMKIAISTIGMALLQAANLAYGIVEEQYLNAVKMGDSQVFYNYYYSRATYFNQIGHSEWNAKALEAIRVNMKDQHMQMKFQLQERHKEIANHVGQDVSENCIYICYHSARFQYWHTPKF